jgi:hypothetical protein
MPDELKELQDSLNATPADSADATFDEISRVFDLGDLAPSTPVEEAAPVGNQSGEGAVTETQAAPEPTASPAPTPTPAAGQATEEQPAASPTPPAAVNTEVALENASLKAQLAALQQQVQGLTAGKEPDAKPAAAGEETQVQPYTVQLPADVTNQLFGEDPAQAVMAMNVIVGSILTKAHQVAVAEAAKVREYVDNAAIRPQAETEAAREREQLRTDYFKAFPAHNNPLYEAVIAQQAAELTAEFPSLGWNDDMRNALGARVSKVLASMGVNPTTVGDPTPAAAKPNPAPAAFLSPGTRSPGTGLVNDDPASLVGL